jgi:hypothetical protein
MKTQKKAVEAVSAANVATGVSGGPVGTTVLPTITSGPVTVTPVLSGSATAGTTTQGLTAQGSTRLPSGLLKELQAVLQGIQQDIPEGGSLTAVNGSYTKASMVSTLQSTLTLYAAVATQEATLKQTRLTLTAAIPATRQYYAELKGVITGFFHAGNPMLADFGFKPKKAPAQRTGAAMAEAALRSEQTRLIRGTVGPKKKLAVKYVGPITAASVPGAVAAPATGGAAAAVQTAAAAPVKPAGQ